MAFEFFNRGRRRETDEGRVPPGQVVTPKFPVLHYGSVPATDLDTWEFKVTGLVDHPLALSWAELTALPAREVVVDIHCVTRWSKLDTRWLGVPFTEIASLASPQPAARYVLAHAEQRFTSNLPLDVLMDEDVLLACGYDGRPLEPEHGYPLRLLVPKRYFWKSAKWLRGLEFRADDKPGFWEDAGYHMNGDPWKEERYAAPTWW
ncbi:MAG: sulfite oxidase-like oxidoreductase [Chloroflexota bacterium]|nr:sulfite oxidase-like oxidoreductase [Chloroflexota bacterium]